MATNIMLISEMVTENSEETTTSPPPPLCLRFPDDIHPTVLLKVPQGTRVHNNNNNNNNVLGLFDLCFTVSESVYTMYTVHRSHHQNAGQNHDIKIIDRSFENVA
jgi:hypothetical protein